MPLKTKIENYCEKHFGERLKILLEKREQYILDILKTNATMTFGCVSGHEDCRVPNCVDFATRCYVRVDFYDSMPELKE